MLWTDSFLFLHYPKTAGKSLSKVFVSAWPRPIYGLVSPGQLHELSDCDQSQLYIEVGIGHENMRKASLVLGKMGIDVSALKAVFLCVRNPYDLMVSNYFYMRKLYKKHADRKNFEIAMTNTFEDYCEKVKMPDPHSWLSLENKIPEQLQLIHFERLNEDLMKYGDLYGFKVPKLPHLNPSEHDQYSAYLTPKAEAAIYEHFKFFFELGGYAREAESFF